MPTLLLTFIFLLPALPALYAYVFSGKRKKDQWIARRLLGSTDPAGDTRSLNRGMQLLVNLGRRAGQTNEKDRLKLKTRLSHAGYRTAFAPEAFTGLRISALLGGLVLSLAYAGISRDLDLNFFTCAFFLSATGYLLPPVLLNRAVRRRDKKIFRELPDTLDLMVLCIEAGLGFEMALLRVSRELKDVAPVLSREFAQYFFETRGGVARNEALENMKTRNNTKGLDAFIDVVLQSLRFGTDIASALRVHSEFMRNERQQIAEEKGAKIAVKLTLPLVFMVLPALLIVILGPAVLRLINYFSG